jgi:hypothetical protein
MAVFRAHGSLPMLGIQDNRLYLPLAITRPAQGMLSHRCSLPM